MQGLIVVIVHLVKSETVDYGYNMETRNHMDVSGTHALSGTATTTRAAAEAPGSPTTPST